jgi:hypothetical protein
MTDTDTPNDEHGCYTEYGVSGFGVAAKLSRKEPMDEAMVKEMGEEIMLSIADKCMKMGAKCIGHIKSHIRTDAGTIKADTLGTATGAYSHGKMDHPVNDLYMAINSIVQGIPEESVKNATLDGLHEIADKHEMDVVKEKEHTYFDEFDFTTSKQDYIKQLEEQLKKDEIL